MERIERPPGQPNADYFLAFHILEHMMALELPVIHQLFPYAIFYYHFFSPHQPTAVVKEIVVDRVDLHSPGFAWIYADALRQVFGTFYKLHQTPDFVFGVLDPHVLLHFTVMVDANLLLLEFSPIIVLGAFEGYLAMVSCGVTARVAAQTERIRLLVDYHSAPFRVFEGYGESRWYLVFLLHLVWLKHWGTLGLGDVVCFVGPSQPSDPFTRLAFAEMEVVQIAPSFSAPFFRVEILGTTVICRYSTFVWQSILRTPYFDRF